MPDDGATSPHDAFQASQSEPDQHSDSEPTGPDAMAEALGRLAEAREYFAHLLAAEVERFKLRLRRAAMWAIIGLTALVLLLAVLVAAAGLLLIGLAELVGSLLGGHAWLGSLVVGGGALLLGAFAIGWGMWAWQASAFDATRERFAERKRHQQGRFGRSVEPSDEEQTDE